MESDNVLRIDRMEGERKFMVQWLMVAHICERAEEKLPQESKKKGKRLKKDTDISTHSSEEKRASRVKANSINV